MIIIKKLRLKNSRTTPLYENHIRHVSKKKKMYRLHSVLVISF
jgi:hypothetical protein